MYQKSAASFGNYFIDGRHCYGNSGKNCSLTTEARVLTKQRCKCVLGICFCDRYQQSFAMDNNEHTHNLFGWIRTHSVQYTDSFLTSPDRLWWPRLRRIGPWCNFSQIPTNSRDLPQNLKMLLMPDSNAPPLTTCCHEFTQDINSVVNVKHHRVDRV